jgi:hypothetical protein
VDVNADGWRSDFQSDGEGSIPSTSTKKEKVF